METAVSGLGGEAKARIAGLYVDNRAIASLILLQSKDTVWTWKIAYDEAFARASPGVQLMLHATTCSRIGRSREPIPAPSRTIQ